MCHDMEMKIERIENKDQEKKNRKMRKHTNDDKIGNYYQSILFYQIYYVWYKSWYWFIVQKTTVKLS